MRILKIGIPLLATAVLLFVFEVRKKGDARLPTGAGAVAAYAVKPAPKSAFLPTHDFAAAALAPQSSAPSSAAAARVPAPAPVVPGTIESALSARRLIRSASISIELPSYDEGARRVEDIAASLGGYVAEAKASSAEGERASGTLAVRVPADRFGEAFRRLSGLGTVRSREIRSQDVTKEYLDLETRVRVKRDAEARMREVLRNRPAKLSDIVEAEQELTRIVEEIETMEAQRLLYDRQVALATIALNLFEPEAARPAIETPSVLAPIRAALRESGLVLSSSVAGLIYTLAVSLPWALLLALAVLFVRRFRGRRSAAAAQPL